MKHPSDPFETELASHAARLFGVARRLTGRGDTAEDLVQDTMVKALEARAQFLPGTNMRAWLTRILTNTYINRVRHQGVVGRAMDAADAEPGADAWVGAASLRGLRDPNYEALLSLAGGEVGKALDALPADYRVAVVLCDIEDFQYEEIGEIMGCPLGTVMSRLHRARKLLQSALFEHARELGILPQVSPGEAIDFEAYRARRARG